VRFPPLFRLHNTPIDKPIKPDSVVLTSSVAAVMGGVQDKEGCFDEDDWNTSSKLSSSSGLDWYRLSKTLAEKKAWEMAYEFGFSLSTINPSFIIGPPRTPRTDSTSLANMVAVLEGNPPLRGATNMVDVR
jgi:dihydroflavonol-4-reductase